MVGGFNTNVRYKGRTFHVQTEDSGPNVAKIVTLLYQGGTILLSRKTAYGADSAEPSREAVRALMEKQHCDMVETLKAGGFDSEIGLGGEAAEPKTPKAVSVAPRKPAAPPARAQAAPASPPRRAAPREEAPVRDFGHGVITQKPLDEIVLAHLAPK